MLGGYCRVGAAEALDFRRRYGGGASLEQVARAVGRSVETVWRHLRRNGLTRSLREGHALAVATGRAFLPPDPRTWFFNEGFFEMLTPESAWVLGLVYGDGNISKKNSRLSISCGLDEDIARKVATLLGYRGPLYFESNCWKLEVNSKRCVASLKALGVIPAKTYTMTFPTVLTSVLPHFVRGLWDSDGGLRRRKQRNGYLEMEYTSASRPFVESLRDLIATIVGPTSTVGTHWSRKSTRPSFRITYCGPKAATVCAWMYRESVPSTRADRKFAVMGQEGS